MEPQATYKNAKPENGMMKLHQGMVTPQATDLEVAVLGAMMVNTDAVHEVTAILPSEDVFYKIEHRVIYKAIKALAQDMKPIDMLTIVEQLKVDGNYDRSGGVVLLNNVMQSVSSAAHVEYHCRIVLQKHISRLAIKLANNLVSQAYSPETDVLELLANTSNQLSGLQDLTLRGSQQMSMSEALDQVSKRVEFLSSQEEGAITGVTCGLSKVDKFTSGWQPGTYVTIGARPGMGKTSFLVGNMVAAAKQKVNTGFISLEMNTVELVGRAVAVDSHFHLSQLLTKGFEKESYFAHLQEVTERMKHYGCFFNDEVTDITDIIATARKWKRDNNIGILFIDYLQLIGDKSYKGSMREQELSRITRKIKLLAKELMIPVICPAQLSRKVEDRGGVKRPILSDLRETGAIEQDSDIVAFLYRPEVYGFDITDDEDMQREGCNSELIFSKFRAGGTGTVLIYWKGDKTRFYNQQYVPYSPVNEVNDSQKQPSDAFGIQNDGLPY